MMIRIRTMIVGMIRKVVVVVVNTEGGARATEESGKTVDTENREKETEEEVFADCLAAANRGTSLRKAPRRQRPGPVGPLPSELLSPPSSVASVELPARFSATPPATRSGRPRSGGSGR